MVPAIITARRVRNDMIDDREAADSRDSTARAEPIEATEHTEPTDPIDRQEPMEPTDSTDPFEATESTESVDHRDQAEPEEVEVTSPFSRLATRPPRQHTARPPSGGCREPIRHRAAHGRSS